MEDSIRFQPKGSKLISSVLGLSRFALFAFIRAEKSQLMLRMRMPVSTGRMVLPFFAVTVQLRPRALAL